MRFVADAFSLLIPSFACLQCCFNHPLDSQHVIIFAIDAIFFYQCVSFTAHSLEFFVVPFLVKWTLVSVLSFCAFVSLIHR